jgi:DNA-binding response OmpR family regulator
VSQDPKKTIGRILLEQRAISPDKLDKALAQHVPGKVPLASRLTEEGLVSELDALKALSTQRGVPGIDLNQVLVKLSDLDAIPREVAARHKVFPVLVREDRIFCAMAHPEDRKVLEEIELSTGKRVFAYIALETVLLRVLGEAYDRKAKGLAYFVGPACPDEVLERTGVPREEREPLAKRKPPPPPPPRAKAPEPPAPMFPPDPERERRFRPSSADLVAQRDQVVVDDTMRKLAHEAVAHPDFTDAGPEVSVVDVPPRAEPQKAGAKKILVVDDEPEIRKMLVRLLKERGFVVVEADRGKLALQLVKLESPDLIVLDAMLPEIHGFDIARRIRGSSRYGHVPIVMVSAVYRGWRIAEDVKTSYGVDAYIEKPFRVADVVAAVETALSTSRERIDPERLSKEAERLLDEGVAAYKSGKLDQAIGLLEAGVKVDPLAYRLRFHLGLLYGKQGQLYDAIEQLERALELQARHFPSLKNLAILYQQAGFRNKAVEAWERALAVAPDDETRKAIKGHLVSLL